jgi:hypothetical protein
MRFFCERGEPEEVSRAVAYSPLNASRQPAILVRWLLVASNFGTGNYGNPAQSMAGLLLTTDF